MQTKEIMTTDVACCTVDTPLPEIARLMDECDCGAIPVVDDDNSNKVIGMVTDRDIVTRAVASERDVRTMTARDCMSTSVRSVRDSDDVREAIRAMEEHQVRRVPVTDSRGGCCGIIAQADIARNASEHDTAEVVRDISQPNRPMARGS